MIVKPFSYLSIGIFLLVLVAPGAQAKNTADSVGALFDGPPRLASTVLDPSAYVQEKVQKLTHARIAYVNWDAINEILHSLGVSSLPRTLTPGLARAILQKAGFAKPLDGDSAEFFANEFRILYSTRYGGHFIGGNFGAGRNGASGVVDIKGIGKTILVRPWANGDHASGAMGLNEAIKEAIWSNISHEELPFGANRVLFVLTTGTRVNPKDLTSEARALLVREDPVRPAYFQPNQGVTSDRMSNLLRDMHMAADQKRMEHLLTHLLQALPKPANLKVDASPVEILRAGLFELCDRTATQFAKDYSGQIVRSGISTSNIELSGKALDFGSTTAMLGYGRVHVINDEAPQGSTESIKNDLILEFAQDLRDALPKDLKAGVPSDEDLSQRVDSQFQAHVTQNFLELAGIPKEYSAKLGSSAAGRKLSATLLQIAQDGNTEILQWTWEGLPRQGTYNLQEILTALIYGQDLSKVLPNQTLRDQLKNDFAACQTKLRKIAITDGIAEATLLNYARLAIPERNRPLTEVVSGTNFFNAMTEVSSRFLHKDEASIQNYIDGVVARNIREYKAPPFQLSVGDGNEQITLDLKTGKVSRPRAVEKDCKRVLGI